MAVVLVIYVSLGSAGRPKNIPAQGGCYGGLSRAIFCEVRAGYHLYTIPGWWDGGAVGPITSGDKQKTLTPLTTVVIVIIITSAIRHNDKQAESGNTFLLLVMMMMKTLAAQQVDTG